MERNIVEKNIGIDFGTTNTVIYSRDAKGKLKKIGGTSIKSAVYFKSRHDYVIGEKALQCGAIKEYSKALVTDFKPNIMEKFDIVAEDGDSFRLKGEAIARMFLSAVLSEYVEDRFLKMFGNAEMKDCDKTVITVPAKFNVEQKARIKHAADSALFSNISVAFEPTAAAIAASDSDISDSIIAVYDFGGGTFDVSVIEKDGDDHYIPIDQDGDNNLGGNYLTELVAEELFLPMLREQGIEISLDIDDMEFDEANSMSEDEYVYNLRTIKDYIESLKIHFTEEQDDYDGIIRIIQYDEEKEFKVRISLSDFEDSIREAVHRTVEITGRLIERVKSKKKYVKKIIMAGGSSQLRLAEQLLKEEFENEGIEIIRSDDVFNLIAKGALLMAEKQKMIRVEEKTNLQFGVGVRTGIGLKKFDMLIDADKYLPIKSSKTFPIDNNILSAGELEISCYEKDIKSYPNALTERDKGIEYINTYRISIDKSLNPSEIEVTFEIQSDGTLNLYAQLKDNNGALIDNFNAQIMSDNELE